MRKLSVWMLVIAFVLGIGFAVAAEELDCWPPQPCPGNIPLEKDMIVNLNVPPYARLCINDMSVWWCEPGDWLKSGSRLLPPTVPFSGGANCPIVLTLTSQGFSGPDDDARANNWIKYLFWVSPAFHTFGTEAAPEAEAVDVEALGLDWVTPGTSRSFYQGQGKWLGTVTATGQWQDDFFHDWTKYTAGQYQDTIKFTVAAQTAQ